MKFRWNWLLILILTIEEKLIKIVDFPFVRSILCIAQKGMGDAGKSYHYDDRWALGKIN